MPTPFDQQHLAELIRVLAGETRSAARSKKAVRIEDLSGLLQLNPSLKATKAAGATPTAAEFAALLDDVRHLHQRLTAVREALQKLLL